MQCPAWIGAWLPGIGGRWCLTLLPVNRTISRHYTRIEPQREGSDEGVALPVVCGVWSVRHRHGSPA
jgi:hypothetical protein